MLGLLIVNSAPSSWARAGSEPDPPAVRKVVKHARLPRSAILAQALAPLLLITMVRMLHSLCPASNAEVEYSLVRNDRARTLKEA